MAKRIPLPSGLPHFSLQVELDGTTFTLEFRWNSRDGAWYMNLEDAEGTHILSGIKVVADWPLGARFQVAGLPAGQLSAVDTSGAGLDPGFTDLGTRVQILYLTAAEG